MQFFSNYLSMYVQVTITKYHNWVDYKQQTFIYPSSGGWKPNTVELADSVSGKSLFLNSYLFSVLSPQVRGKGALGAFFKKKK